eukprot:g2573.t1
MQQVLHSPTPKPRRPSLSEVLENHLQEVQRWARLRGTCFFPFDPYRLAHSNIFLMGIYRVWEHGDDGFEEESHVDDEFGAGERREAAEAESMEDVDEEDFTDEADVASPMSSTCCLPCAAVAKLGRSVWAKLAGCQHPEDGDGRGQPDGLDVTDGEPTGMHGDAWSLFR